MNEVTFLCMCAHKTIVSSGRPGVKNVYDSDSQPFQCHGLFDDLAEGYRPL